MIWHLGDQNGRVVSWLCFGKNCHWYETSERMGVLGQKWSSIEGGLRYGGRKNPIYIDFSVNALLHDDGRRKVLLMGEMFRTFVYMLDTIFL